MPRRKAKKIIRKQGAARRVALPDQLFRERLRRRESPFEQIADLLTGIFGTTVFLSANLGFFALWIVWNSGLITDVMLFDPYPFGMLTMIVSLEAIALSIIVLMSQNRSARMDEAREEIDFQIDLQAERQIALIMHSLDKIMHHMKVSHVDDGDSMEAVDIEKLERRVIHDIDTD